MNPHTTNLLENIDKYLDILDLTNQQISGPLCLNKFKYLRKLYCANNSINQLMNLPDTIEFINCSNNCISDFELNNLNSLKKINFEFNPIDSLIMYYSQSLKVPKKLPDSIKILHFPRNFNKPVELPEFTTDLKFGNEFNQPIQLTKYIKYLYLGNSFNQNLILGNSVEYLYLGNSFNQNLILGNSVIELCIDNDNFSSDLILSNNLTKLSVRSTKTKKIKLPDSIIDLKLGLNIKYFNSMKIPISLENLILFDNCANQNNSKPVVIKNFIKKLELTNSFDRNILLPESLKYLTFGSTGFFNKKLILPEQLEFLELGAYFNQHIIFPNSLKHLIINSELVPNVIIPNIKHLQITTENIHLIDYLPNSLESLVLINERSRTHIHKKIKRITEFANCLENLPNQLKKLKLEDKNKTHSHTMDIRNLPDSIEELELHFKFSGRITHIPEKLIKIAHYPKYKHKSDFDNYNKL